MPNRWKPKRVFKNFKQRNERREITEKEFIIKAVILWYDELRS